MIDLKKILKENPDCLSSRATFKAVLADSYPTEKRLINILTTLFESGIAGKIANKRKNGSVITENELQSILIQIENDYGIVPKYSSEAVNIWAKAFGVTVPVTTISTESSKTGKDIIKPAPVPITYIEGNADDYELFQKPDGYYIARFNGFEDEEMTIPSIIGGKHIVGIAPYVFNGLSTVKKISISDGIRVISDNAFSKCTSLVNIILPQTLEKLGRYTFSECCQLQEIDIPYNVKEIPEGCFYQCRGLKRVKLPDNLEIIGQSSFAWGMYLKEIHIPVGTTTIRDQAFFCNDLAAVFIPPSVTTIEDGAFLMYNGKYYCSSSILTIYCTAGSTAMVYARRNNIKCAKAQF